MKRSILTFFSVFILLGGMSSSASDGMTQIVAGLETQASTAAVDDAQAQKAASSTSMPGSAVMLLIATGLIGIAGVSRSNKS